MRNRFIVFCALALIAALLCGCGAKDTGANGPATVTPRVLNAAETEPETPTSAPASEKDTAPTPETPPTPTPTPSPEPEKVWFEGSGLTFTKQGEFTFHTDLSSNFEGEDNVAIDSAFTLEQQDGKFYKTLSATLQITPYLVRYEDGGYAWSWCAMYGFLDQYTGRMIVCEIEDGDSVDTTIDFNGKSYDVSLRFSIVSKASYFEMGSSSKLFPSELLFTVTCPEDYEGAAFFVCGCSSDDFAVYEADPIGSYDTFDNSGYDFFVFDGNA